MVTIKNLNLPKIICVCITSIKLLIAIIILSYSCTAYSKSLRDIDHTSFMFCGVNKGYQGNLVSITDPQQAINIVKNKLLKLNPIINYAIYPGLVIYRQDYGCPDGGEVIAVVTSAAIEPEAFIKMGQYLKEALLQNTLSIVTYTDKPALAISRAKLSRGFQATVQDCSIKKLAVEWQHQAQQHMHDSIYVTAGLYTTPKDNAIFIQGEANPDKPHLNSVEKIKQWEKMAILVAKATATALKIKPIHLAFRDVYFTYLTNN